jgi:hypothetical protein
MRKRKRNPGGFIGKLKANTKDVFNKSTFMNSLYVALGATTTPVSTGIIKGVVNSETRKIIPESGPLNLAVKVIVSGLVSMGLGMFIKNKDIVKYMFLGGLAGTINDGLAEYVLPRFNLSDYLTLPAAVSDYLTMAPGVGDYLTLPNGVRGYADVNSISNLSGRTANEY